MKTTKMKAGIQFPLVKTMLLTDQAIDPSKTKNDHWRMFVVYRGAHCPMCTKMLKELKEMHSDFEKAGVEILAVSADSKEKAKRHAVEECGVEFDVAYDLSVEDMKTLGTYISDPMDATETDRVFSEPAVFLINESGKMQIVDISNNPFSRPDFKTLLKGINYIRENNYPIRGRHDY
ncbi:MAG: redoxin domain-containing protein [Bdellovibrionota bacterium]